MLYSFGSAQDSIPNSDASSFRAACSDDVQLLHTHKHTHTYIGRLAVGRIVVGRVKLLAAVFLCLFVFGSRRCHFGL